MDGLNQGDLLLKWAAALGIVLLGFVLMVGGAALLGVLLDPDRKPKPRPAQRPAFRPTYAPPRRRGFFRRRPPALPYFRPPNGNGHGPYGVPYAVPESEEDDE